MSIRHTVVGIDPGLTTGIAVLTYREPEHGECGSVPEAVSFAQCTPDLAGPILDTIKVAHGGPFWLAIEAFVVGRGSMRSGHAGAVTRDLIGRLSTRAVSGSQLQVLPAATVKPWAIDERLAAADLIDGTKGMPHARDAARHALHLAVKKFARDPLSRRSTTR